MLEIAVHICSTELPGEWGMHLHKVGGAGLERCAPHFSCLVCSLQGGSIAAMVQVTAAFIQHEQFLCSFCMCCTRYSEHQWAEVKTIPDVAGGTEYTGFTQDSQDKGAQGWALQKTAAPVASM
jgi:hypothetical protein